MMERSPFDRGKSLILKENNKRLRFLIEDEIQPLLDACPMYLRSIVECAIMTGMRRGEILSLKWDQVRSGQPFKWIDRQWKRYLSQNCHICRCDKNSYRVST